MPVQEGEQWIEIPKVSDLLSLEILLLFCYRLRKSVVQILNTLFNYGKKLDCSCCKHETDESLTLSQALFVKMCMQFL